MKSILVEDEPRVRKGLAETIDWPRLGFELLGTAGNGLEGLELFRSLEPELVVADIRMPVMDGLAMTEAILELRPSAKIIIISGHDEFEYAQRCVALGVTNYLLKPIGKAQFQAELEKVYAEWRREKRERELSRQWEEQLQSHLPVLRNAFLEDWLNGASHKTEQGLKESFDFLVVPVDFRLPAAVAVFEPDLEGAKDLTQEERSLLQFRMGQLVEESTRHVGLSFQRGNGQTVVLFQSVSASPIEELLEWAERLRGKVAAALQVGVTAGVGSQAVPVPELPAMFREALRVLRLKLSVGTDMVLSELLVRPVQETLASLNEAEGALLSHGVEMNDEAEIRGVVEGLFRRWKETGVVAYPDEVSYQFTGLFTALVHRLGRSIRDFLDEEWMRLWRHPEQFRSLEEMEAWWVARFTELSGSYAGFRTDRKTSIVQQVKQYIDEHIYENITRDEVARHVYINSSYVSRLFREVTGESFSDFVLRRKMEKAIHLLQVERVMVYEVADRLGYKDPSYFARVFKKFTGKSPTDFQ